MQPTITQLYQKIKDIMPLDQFEQEINHYDAVWEHLIDKNLIALYLVDKHGRNHLSLHHIKDLQPNNEYVVQGTITAIQNERTFTRKNGTTGRVLNLDLSDNTGTCRLVLWNDDIDLLKQHHLTIHSPIKIINGYTKTGPNGIELHLGKWGMLDIPETTHSLPSTPLPQAKENILTGILINREPSRPFFRDNGEFGFITKISLQQNNTYQEIILWNEKVKEIQQFKIGDQLTIEAYTEKNNNGTRELHLNGNSTIRKT
ncbi:MAG: hypothetical protein KKG04_04690 [Candidatus Thermoplasmatota archaeon]|nr:hypothetical protein [Candidatus Thermoplasmatota archaeon]